MTPEQSTQLAVFVVDELAGLEGTDLRVAANKIRRALNAIDPVEEQATSLKDLLSPMGKVEAETFGGRAFEYGKFTGQRPIDVEYDDLAWLCDLRRKNWRELHRYLLTRKGGNED
jgi:hypothetical protein